MAALPCPCPRRSVARPERETDLRTLLFFCDTLGESGGGVRLATLNWGESACRRWPCRWPCRPCPWWGGAGRAGGAGRGGAARRAGQHPGNPRRTLLLHTHHTPTKHVCVSGRDWETTRGARPAAVRVFGSEGRGPWAGPRWAEGRGPWAVRAGPGRPVPSFLRRDSSWPAGSGRRGACPAGPHRHEGPEGSEGPAAVLYPIQCSPRGRSADPAPPDRFLFLAGRPDGRPAARRPLGL